MFGLLVAGEGFYSDVAWHIALGRDNPPFTAPHTSIVLGLGLNSGPPSRDLLRNEQPVPLASASGTPRPMVDGPTCTLGVAAVTGFPLDELWHREYGIDVTMRSPTHMMMILGAAFSGWRRG